MDIYDVFKPIHLCSQFIGLTAFSTKRNRHQNCEGRVSVFNWICILLLTTWNVCSILLILVFKGKIEYNNELTSAFFEQCLLVLIIMNCLVLIYSAWWFVSKRKDLVAIFNAVKDVDKSLLESGADIRHSKHRNFLIVFMIFLKIVNFSEVALSKLAACLTGSYSGNFQAFFSELLGLENLSLLFSQFIFLMWSIRKRFQIINCCLAKILLTKQRTGELSSQEAMALNKMPMIYDKIVDISESMSHYYGTPVSKSFKTQNLNSTVSNYSVGHAVHHH